MAGAQTNIVVNLNGVDKKLMRLAKEAGRFKTPLENSATYMESAITRRFTNNSWQGLKASTIARHPHRAGGKPLNDTGNLKMSVTGSAKRRIVGSKLYYGFGTGIIYGATHHFGRGAIPARPFLHFDDKDEKAIKLIFEDYLKGVIERG